MKFNYGYNRTRYACYATSISMAAAVNISPLLFVTFRNMYGVSYTLLGLLVVLNFSTQLCVDLIFSFFTRYFDIHKVIRTMPAVCVAGLLLYVIVPTVLPQFTYLGLVAGTILFAIASGLSEVLTSPVIASMRSDNPERDMSILHSTYAWGVVGVVVFSTLFLELAGTHNWKYLVLILTLIPIGAFVLFSKAKLPDMDMGGDNADGAGNKISLGLMLCIACIFLGGAAECTMTQWVSGYTENAIGLPKLWGDILGMALFGALLGIGRSSYARYSIDIYKVMLVGMAGSAVCYILSALCINPASGIAACAFTGLFSAMLWPGTIIYTGDKFPDAGVYVYALLAAGGDCGASVAPQLLGIIADKVGESSFAADIAYKIGITAEQTGMRAGMLVAALFPLAGVALLAVMKKHFQIRGNQDAKS